MSNSEMGLAPSNVGMRCCICVVVLISFVYLALDGHHTKINLLFPGSTFGNPLDEIDDHITWMHGWPVACYVRNSWDTAKINTAPGITDMFAKELQFSSFPFDSSPPLAFSAMGLVVDIGVLILLLVGVWWTLRGTRLPRMQFTIRSLMVATAFLALLIATNLLFSRLLLTLVSLLVVCSAVLYCLARVARSWSGRPRIAG